jgi:hypothetical protein
MTRGVSPQAHPARPSADVHPPASADTLLALSDRAYEAQCALTAIKSYAYGGIVTDKEARKSVARLREAVAGIESIVNGQDQEPLLGRTD